MKNMMLALILLSILLLSSFVVQVQADSTWSIQTVDANGALGTGVSMALDSKDKPHLCYIAYVDGYYRNPAYLTYASWNGSGWSFQTVISNADVSFGNIALDARGYPHFTYYTDGLLMYASWKGADWNTQIVDSTSGSGGAGFLCLDFYNNPHISYLKSSNLMYAELAGAEWGIQTVDSRVDIPVFRSIVLDSSGNPCIGYYGWQRQKLNGIVMYAKGTRVLSFIQILGIAVFVSLLLAIAIAVIVKKRMTKKNEERKR
jgi:hypothetical protein